VRGFDEAVELIEKYSEVVLLADGAGARVAVCPALQGRVMASAPPGDAPRTNAWINEEALARGDADLTFNNYGGEERFWLGPEAGQFGLWFRGGEPFDMEHWATPPALNRGGFKVMSQTTSGITMARHLDVKNYAGTEFSLDVERAIAVIEAEELGDSLRCTLPGGVEYVGFASDNRLTNAGAEKMTPRRGLVSIWTLGQFIPSPRTVVIVPFVPDDAGGTGPVVNDGYFGPVPAERLKQGDGYLLFRADGEYRSKLGIRPGRASDRLGSIDFENNLLTVVHFDLPGTGRYVNAMWELQDDPFAGDVVNSYNDGPAEPGKASLGGFYELETSSPAGGLAPG